MVPSPFIEIEGSDWGDQTEEVETIDVQARFDKSTRNYHVFKIKPNSQGITGAYTSISMTGLSRTS